MPLQLRIASHSEIGLVRKNNQDSGYASPQLLVVADGMGGAAAGDLASAVAVDAIRRIDAPEATGDQMLQTLADSLHEANSRIADLVEADYALEGMGTTVTGALFDGTQVALAHIGDSRAYLLHESRLERLTRDHSWVQSLIDDGKISEGEAAVHPHRSLLLKVLNGQPANDPDLTLVRLEIGDRLLLCSDGLCGLVDDPVIEQALLSPDIDEALRRLIDAALAEGGVDNITAILADVVESGGTTTTAVLGAAAELDIPAVVARPRPEAVDYLDPEDDEDEAEEPALPPAADSDTPHAARSGGARALAAAPGNGADDEERYRPQPPRQRRLLRPLLGVLVLALVVGAGLASAYAWTRTQYYVGAADDKVAIFQGLSDSLPGVSLSRVYEVQPLSVSQLPPFYQERVRSNIDAMGLAAARETVGQLTEAANRCALVARPTASTSTSGAVSPRTPLATSTPDSPAPGAPGSPSTPSSTHAPGASSSTPLPADTKSPRPSVSTPPEQSC